MTSYLRDTLSVIRQEWFRFLRSRRYLVLGILTPLALAAILWVLIVRNGSTTADGLDRWQYFQSELNRFGEDVNGTFNFEKSEDRLLFQLIDKGDLGLETAIRKEFLSRDLQTMIDYLNQTPFEDWSWFHVEDGEQIAGPEQLWERISQGTVSAEELISTYGLKHHEIFSSRLATTDESWSWFVDGWNSNLEDIAKTIPEMSFSRVVQVLDGRADWIQSVWVPARIELPTNFLETHQAHCYIAISRKSYVWFSPDKINGNSLQNWFEELISTQLNQLKNEPNAQVQSTIDHSLREKLPVQLALRKDDSLDQVVRRYEMTQYLSTAMYTLIYLLSVVGLWWLLYYDPNLKLKESGQLNELSYSMIDGRVIGTMMKIFSILVIWFVLLFLPIWLLVGTIPAFGIGALGQFFHPHDKISYLIFLIIGLLSFGYIFHILSRLRQALRSITLMLVALNFTIIAVPPSFVSSPSAWDSLCFFPLIGLSIVIKKSFGYPDPISYTFIVMIAIGFLFGFRLFVKSEEKFRCRKKELKYAYQPH